MDPSPYQITTNNNIINMNNFIYKPNCGRCVVFSGYSGFPHQWNWPPRYNWYIVESGIKHHNLNPINQNIKWLVKNKQTLNQIEMEGTDRWLCCMNTSVI